MKTTPNSVYLLSETPGGVFIATMEEGGQGTNPGPKRGRGRGHPGAARAALRAARGPVYPLSGPVPGFIFAAPGIYRISSLGQWLSLIGF